MIDTEAPKGLIAIDPSKPGKSTGLAYFYAGKLVVAEFNPRFADYRAPVLVIEFPQVYPGNRSEDPNDLLQVARGAGQWEHWSIGKCMYVYRVAPREWTAGVPKDVRCKRVIEQLSDEEITKLPRSLADSKLHNVLDAVGLGLWALDRMTSPCVPSVLKCVKEKL